MGVAQGGGSGSWSGATCASCTTYKHTGNDGQRSTLQLVALGIGTVGRRWRRHLLLVVLAGHGADEVVGEAGNTCQASHGVPGWETQPIQKQRNASRHSTAATYMPRACQASAASACPAPPPRECVHRRKNRCTRLWLVVRGNGCSCRHIPGLHGTPHTHVHNHQQSGQRTTHVTSQPLSKAPRRAQPDSYTHMVVS